MKSLNTKKIVAMATGAALLGSALLGAVSYQNTELINDNGVPMAKVVVGSNAHISDGVAAANIAAVLGNMAFKQVAVSATVDGVSGLSCDVSEAGAGTCSVLSKSVDLEVVTPAGTIPAGAYGFETYIDDYVDSDLLDRELDEDTAFPQAGADVGAKKIKSGDFNPLADYAVKDSQSSVSTIQKQSVFVRSETDNVVEYDTSDDEFIFDGVQFAYEIEFETPGLPVCSEKKNGTWADCKYGSIDTDKQIENHRVNVKFLGEEWIISELSTADQGDNLVKIAKESAYSPKLQIGESLDLGDGNTLVLGDLKPASGWQVSDIAIFSVYNAADEEIASKTVSAGATTEITAGSNTYRVRVYQVAPGYTLTEKWAEVAVFANELELKDNTKLDNEDNSDWRVYLDWKEDGTSGVDDHIYKIQLVSEFFDNTLAEGESLNIVENPAIWRFTFTGLDLDSSDYVNVDVTLQNRMNFYNQKVESSPEVANKTSFGNSTDDKNNVAVKISSDSRLFEIDDLVGETFESRALYFSPFGSLVDENALIAFEHDSYGVFVGDASTLKYMLNDKKYDMQFFWFNGTDASTAVEVDFASKAFNEAAVDNYGIVFIEDNEKSAYSYLGLSLRETAADSYKLEVYGASDDDEALYNFGANDTLTAANYADLYANYSVEAPLFTQRGSKVVSVSESKARIQLAKKVGKPTFLLQSTGAETSEEGAQVYSNLHEGDEIKVLGATVRVKNINVETGACEVTGGDATVSGLEGLSCILNANADNLGERQDIPTDLVVMDTAATNVETVIAVGGPMVNTITEALLAGESPLASAGDVYVEEVAAGKIVIAGYTADDTLTAAQNFIATLKGQ